MLLLAATIGSALLSMNVAVGGKPTVTPAAYSVTDLGAPRYSNRTRFWRKAYDINEPDNQGLMDIIGWDNQGSAEWLIHAMGDVVSRVNLPANRVTSVNDNGLVVGHFDNSLGLYANVPGVGTVVLPESDGYSPAAVNNLGHVVAQSDFGEGAMWAIAADGSVSGPFDLGTFRPLDINDWDEMVGMQDSAAAIAWFEQGELQVAKLPGLQPGNFGVATAINNWGEVVGYSTDTHLVTSGTYKPFLWTTGQGLSALGSLGGVHGVAIDINDEGQIVGWSYTASPRNSEQRAFLWENGKMSDLNGKVTADSKRTLQSAEGINNAGHIVGSMFTVQSGTTTLRAFLLTPNP
jgi:probable HAF family extracellular repeat protein